MTRRGFTLLELLIAVFLAAVMMALMYGVVVSTVKAEERIDELTHGTEIGPAVLNLVRQDLDGAFLVDDKVESFRGTDQKGYGGDRDRLDFVSSVPAYGSDQPYAPSRFHGINEVGWQLKDSPEHPGEGALYRRLDPFVDGEPLRGGNLTVVADRVVSFNVEYWNGTLWASTWEPLKQDKKLPAAVKIDLKLKVPDRNVQGGWSERLYSTILPLGR